MIAAAHPWGSASFVVGFGALILCQFLNLQVVVILGLILRGRPRNAAASS